MKTKGTTSQKQYKKRLKLIAMSKTRREATKKKHKQKVDFITKEVEMLRKKREKEFFRVLEQRKLRKKLKDLTETSVDQIQREIEAEPPQPIKLDESNTENIMSISQATNESKNSKKQLDEAVLKKTNKSYCQSSVTQLDAGSCIIHFESEISSSIIALKPNDEPFKFHGVAKLTVLKGICYVNGFKMLPAVPLVAFAPVTHPAISIKFYNDEETLTSLILQEYAVQLELLPESIENYHALILFESLDIEERGRLPGYENVYNMNSVNAGYKQQICSSCWKFDTERCFFEHDCYKDAINLLNSYKPTSCANSENHHKYPVVVTVGGKSAGKSTLNRYLVNRLLEKHSHIYYFDCDVGQTEFTPSGFLSIHKVQNSDPILGPPFTHQLTPKYCCYFGTNTPEPNPTRYMHCLKFLYDDILQDLGGSLDAPLVINTMGWIRDLGLLLLIDTIRMVSPTHILQFESPKANQNLSHLTRSYVQHADGWVHQNPRKIPPFHHVTMKLNTDLRLNEGKYKASDNRMLNLLSFIEKISTNCQLQQNLQLRTDFLRNQFQAINPYCVQLSKVAICIAQDKPCTRKYALALINASPVALCVVADEIANQLTSLSDDDVLPEPPVSRCLGLGVVRGVDVQANAAYIISDLPLSQIKQVNCIVRGDLTFSEAFLIKKEKTKIKPNLPYITFNYTYDAVGSNSFRTYMRLQAKPRQPSQ